MEKHTLGTEAIRAFYTLQCCWMNSEEIYLEQGCLHCGSAATYLIYYTNRNIQNLMLNFIAKYNCHNSKKNDLLDLEYFERDYEHFLELLESNINEYARQHQDNCNMSFEQVDSIFERTYSIAC
ncbi:hypothetical protein F4V57_08000 [Acinetobacter qingfengensis]|uniref:Uncharacterized protein n=1 Tax=Acinetobacter qingfengensis TaxID=1262585 RepID=A0A1E7R5E9_9GAMM|nr:hypothetical protein [Acinetobacter qingfengensis]KAA8733163.1 hypothetical protein F4V57_08000 [Acinetobacter qingfengensis]OEY94560.1 hypothetical protein BJI46_13580 [Acinetobacter qingfengensis]